MTDMQKEVLYKFLFYKKKMLMSIEEVATNIRVLTLERKKKYFNKIQKE